MSSSYTSRVRNLFRGGRNLTRTGRLDRVQGQPNNCAPEDMYPLTDYVRTTVEDTVNGAGLQDIVEAAIIDQLPPLLSISLGSSIGGTVSAQLAQQLPALIADELMDFLPTVRLVACDEVSNKLPGAVAAEVAAQVPAEVSSQLGAQLPAAVSNELAAQLPAAVATAVTNEVAATLPAAVTAEVAAQVPGVVTPAVASAIMTQLPTAIETAIDEDVIPVIAPTVFAIIDTYDFGNVTQTQVTQQIQAAITDDVLPAIAPTVFTILDTYDFSSSIQTEVNNQLSAIDFTPQITATVAAQIAGYDFSTTIQDYLDNNLDLTQEVCDVLDTKLPAEVATQVSVQLPGLVAPVAAAEVSNAITAADIPGQVQSAIDAADIETQVNTLVQTLVGAIDFNALAQAAVAAIDITALVQAAIAAEDIPGQANTAVTNAVSAVDFNALATTAVTNAITAADIPGQATTAVTNAVTAADIPGAVNTAITAADIPGQVSTAVTAADIPGQVSTAITAADIPGQATSAVNTAITAADIPGQATTAVNNAVTAADIPGAVSTAITAADIPGQVSTAITSADIPGQATTAVNNAVTAADIPGQVTTAITAADIPGTVASELTTQLPTAVVGPVNDYLDNNLEQRVCDVLDDKLPTEVSSIVAPLITPVVNSVVSGAIQTAIDALKLPVTITTLSDFPAPVNNVITLDPDVAYRVCGTVVLSNNVLRGSDIRIEGAESGACLVGVTNGPIVTGDGTGTVMSFSNICILNSSSGAAVYAHTDGSDNSRVTFNDTIMGSSGATAAAVIVEDVDNFQMGHTILAAVDGLRLIGNVKNCVVDGNKFGGRVSASPHGGLVSTDTATIGSLMVSNNIFRPTSPRIAVSLSNVATYETPVCIADNSFILNGTSTVFPTAGAFLTEFDPLIKTNSNGGLRDERYFGRCYFAVNNTVDYDPNPGQDNPIGTDPDGNHPEWVLDPLSSRFSLVGASIENQFMQYDGIPTKIFKIELHLPIERVVGSGSPDYTIKIQVNGVDVVGTEQHVEVNGLETVASVVVFAELSTGDQFRPVIRPASSLNGIRHRQAIMATTMIN